VTPNTHTRNFLNSIGSPDDVKGNGTEVLKLGIDYRYIRYFVEAGDTIVYYGEYALQAVSTDAELTEQLEIILSKDQFLNKSYSLVKVLWSTDFEIVPTAFYDEDITDENAGVNEILGGEAMFLFEKIKGVSDLLHSKYPVSSHSGAVLIETLRKLNLTKSKDLFININAQSIEILYFDADGAFKIYNRYEYRTYQDYIYFVLLVADEMGLNREETKAVLMGEVSQDSQLYEVTTRYFRQTAFIKQPADKKITSYFEDYPVHFNYPLYNL
jgi:hypothetical protein